MSAPADCITILRSAKRRLTKQYAAASNGTVTVQGYDRAKYFSVETVRLDGIEGLHRRLLRLETDSSACVIRGEPIASDLPFVRRQKHGSGAAFAEVPRSWVMLDVDGLDLPGVSVLEDPQGAAAAVLARLAASAPELADVSAIVQFSSSAGIRELAAIERANGLPDRWPTKITERGTISAHVWYWLNSPLGEAELLRWREKVLSAGLEVDTATLRTVQPQYTGAPLFNAPLKDPLAGRRTVLVHGLDDAATLDIPAAPPPRPPRAPSADTPVDLWQLADALAAIPNQADWETWNKMGMAIFAATGGSDAGLNLWADWSARSPKHDDAACKERWANFAISPPTVIGAGSLFYMARSAGWRPTSRPESVPRRAPPQTPLDEDLKAAPAEPAIWDDLKNAPHLAAAVDATGRLNLLGNGPIIEPLTTLPEVPWVPEAIRTVPLTELRAAVTRITSNFFETAHGSAETTRTRAYLTACATAENHARDRYVKAERIAVARLALCETITKSRPPGWKAPPGAKQPKAERQAREKAARAVVTSERLLEAWIAAASKCAVPPPEIPPPVMVNTAETGAAKTGITLKMAKAWIETRKAAGLPHRLIWLVPTLRPDTMIEPDQATFDAWTKGKASPRQQEQVARYLRTQAETNGAAGRVKRLGQQALERAQEIGIDAAIYLGIGDTNCRNLEAVDLARIAGADPFIATCGTPDGPHCTFLEWCQQYGYRAALERAAVADMVICAHNFIFEDLPLKVRDGAWAVIIDEGFNGLADFELELTAETLANPSLNLAPPLLRTGAPDQIALQILQDHQPRIIEAVTTCIDGYLTEEALRAVCLTPTAASDVRKASWARKREPAMKPGMSIEEYRDEAKRCEVNSQLRQIATLTYALEGVMTRGQAGAGLISVRHDMLKTGSQTVLVVRGQKKPAAWIAELPALNLNATAILEDVRLVFPSAVMPTVPRAERPFAQTHQVLGRWGRRNLARNPKRIAELRDFIRMQMIGRCTGLVITYQDIEHLFKGIPGVETEHHGNISGDDRYRHYDFLMVIGGGFASPEAIASIAAARGAGAVTVRPPVPMKRIALLASGAAVDVPDVMTYEDPAVDAVHRSIFPPSVTQAAGRQSQIDRTASNPCVTFILANVIMDRLVDSIRCYRTIRVDRLGKMILRDMVVTNAAHMALVHGDLFNSRKAAANARHRFAGTIGDMVEATRAVVRHDPRPWVQIEYKATGQGNGRCLGFTPRGTDEELRQALQAKLGALSEWHVSAFTTGVEGVPTQAFQYFERAVGTTSPMPHLMPPAYMVAGSQTQSRRAEKPPDD